MKLLIFSLSIILLNLGLTLLSHSMERKIDDDSLDAGEEQTSEQVLETMKKATKIKDPFSLRDPFKEPFFREKVIVDYKDGGFKDGVYTNVPSHENLSMSDLLITGVLIGKERRAIASINGGETVILKEGMKIGKEKSEIKAIMPGGIIIVEKITNVYGQVEYLETVIPISENKFSSDTGGTKNKRRIE